MIVVNEFMPKFVSIAVLGLAIGSLSACAGGDESSNSEKIAAPTFPELFTGSPDGADGEAGCSGTYNGDWQSYTSTTANSITMTAGNDCRTINTKTNNSCVFDLGTGGVTQISFDFSVSDQCHETADTTDWLAFWIYTEAPPGKWASTAEVDFIESLNGPSKGLNSNFAGNPTQVSIFPAGITSPWSGSITATFSGTGSATSVKVSNSINPANPATGTLSYSNDYFFVMDTTPTMVSSCTVTVSNLKMQGDLGDASNCAGVGN